MPLYFIQSYSYNWRPHVVLNYLFLLHYFLAYCTPGVFPSALTAFTQVNAMSASTPAATAVHPAELLHLQPSCFGMCPSSSPPSRPLIVVTGHMDGAAVRTMSLWHSWVLTRLCTFQPPCDGTCDTTKGWCLAKVLMKRPLSCKSLMTACFVGQTR